MPSAVLRTWLRGLFEAEGALDDDSVEIAYLLRQAELAGWAADLIRGDILRTTTSQATIEVVTGDSDNVTVTIAYDGGWNGVISSVDPQTVLAEAADILQDAVVRDLWEGWPMCILHGHGAHPEVREDEAVWWCRFRGHAVARIGHLGV